MADYKVYSGDVCNALICLSAIRDEIENIQRKINHARDCIGSYRDGDLKELFGDINTDAALSEYDRTTAVFDRLFSSQEDD